MNLFVITLTSLYVFTRYADSAAGDPCFKKLFDGRPKEWRSSDGKTISATKPTEGYFNPKQCASKCKQTSGCEEFRVKKYKQVPYSGCVLMKAGTTSGGGLTDSYEMYKMVDCADPCFTKLFDGRPKEWRVSSGKEISSTKPAEGFFTRQQCASKCKQKSGCEEFRVKKSSTVPYSGCILMKAGTTYGGGLTNSYEMYKMVGCPGSCGRKCHQKLYDGRPKEWKSSDGKEINNFQGYFTRQQCGCMCENTPRCVEFRVKKSSTVLYSGCVLMKAGTTYSGRLTTSYEVYKLVNCAADNKRDTSSWEFDNLANNKRDESSWEFDNSANNKRDESSWEFDHDGNLVNYQHNTQ